MAPEGHLLQLPDLDEALAAEPQVLVVGTGESGHMRLDPELVAYLQDKGIELVARPTREACRYLNDARTNDAWPRPCISPVELPWPEPPGPDVIL